MRRQLASLFHEGRQAVRDFWVPSPKSPHETESNAERLPQQRGLIQEVCQIVGVIASHILEIQICWL